jgi:hypothetical protein
MTKQVTCAALLLLAWPAWAQQSASYRLSDQVFNAGGHPADAAVPSSASYRITVDAIGEAPVVTGMASAAYKMSGGFAGAYLPPREVAAECDGDPQATCLRFTDKQTLVWPPQRSDGSYNLYREDACAATDLPDEVASFPETPLSGQLYKLLVTAENRLGEEGPRGYDSSGHQRPNPTPCP